MKVNTKNRAKTLVLALSDQEMHALGEIADRRGQTKSAVLRQALRLYESLESRVRCGSRLVLEDPQKNEKAEVILL